MPNPTLLTLGQAAKEAGVSKPTVSEAIKKGRLSATKEGNQYRIDPAELFRVWPKGSRDKAPESVGSALVQQAILETKLEASERENSMLKTQLTDALSERDFRRIELEKEQAKNAQLMLDYDGKKEPKKSRLGAWILGLMLVILVGAVGALFADRMGLISLLF